MRILIDGYNLLFQTRFGGQHHRSGWLPRARSQMVRWLSDQLHLQWSEQTTIVFDRSQSSEQQQDYRAERGIEVRFAVDHPEADDLIEQLINEHSAPKSLTVISSDQRVRRRAKARRSKSVDCQSFLTELERGRYLQPIKAAPSKYIVSAEESKLAPEEVQYWLDQFRDS